MNFDATNEMDTAEAFDSSNYGTTGKWRKDEGNDITQFDIANTYAV